MSKLSSLQHGVRVISSLLTLIFCYQYNSLIYSLIMHYLCRVQVTLTIRSELRIDMMVTLA